MSGDSTLGAHDEVWRSDASWQDALPDVKITRPKGAFCQLDCTALVGYHPAAVFDTMCDTGNQRIFRNAKGVRNRVVLEDTPERKVVELEMLTSWRFLLLSGEFGVHVRLTQDKPNYKLHFELSNPGFMKQFRGVWSVEPVPLPPTKVRLPEKLPADCGRLSLSTGPAPVSPSSPETDPTDLLELALKAADVEESKVSGKDDSQLLVAPTSGFDSLPWYGRGTRVASRVILSQQVQPSISPPPLLSHYLRGIAAKSIIEAMCDIQIEAARQRHGIEECANVREELRKRGYSPVLLEDSEKENLHAQRREGQGHPSQARKRSGLRDWSVAEGRKTAQSRRSKRLSEKDKWKISKSLQDHIKQQCPTVTVEV